MAEIKSPQGTNDVPRPPPRKTILLINGPNLNLLGHREPQIYGHTTLSDITTNLSTISHEHNITLHHFQSNHEGQILDRIHACLLGALPTPLHSKEYAARSDATTSNSNASDLMVRPDAIIINPGALTHTSVALRDALLGVSVPFIEVHISNVHARESFRHHSYLSDKAEAVIAGLGVGGYEAAVRYWAGKWKSSS